MKECRRDITIQQDNIKKYNYEHIMILQFNQITLNSNDMRGKVASKLLRFVPSCDESIVLQHVF